ncbi:unnamed protein product [Rangifer tarandus platyrhynchus]|uniref:Uncharacterized protein n=1 Tax=Rangifer tarandus platyrhynchus TaxID=3082113 RepID=A0ABN8ZPU3_RANTA|nr:unnamed protein product [Rangifer tarandus platyrhynchus]
MWICPLRGADKYMVTTVLKYVSFNESLWSRTKCSWLVSTLEAGPSYRASLSQQLLIKLCELSANWHLSQLCGKGISEPPRLTLRAADEGDSREQRLWLSPREGPGVVLGVTQREELDHVLLPSGLTLQKEAEPRSSESQGRLARDQCDSGRRRGKDEPARPPAAWMRRLRAGARKAACCAVGVPGARDELTPASAARSTCRPAGGPLS